MPHLKSNETWFLKVVPGSWMDGLAKLQAAGHTKAAYVGLVVWHQAAVLKKQPGESFTLRPKTLEQFRISYRNAKRHLPRLEASGLIEIVTPGKGRKLQITICCGIEAE